MAVILTLRHADREGVTNVDLYNGTDGFQVRYDGWLQNRAIQRDDGTWDPVDEAMTLKVVASSDNNLSSKIQSVDRMLFKANSYSNRRSSRVDPVYLHAKLDNETGSRQSLILNGYAAADRGLLGVPVSNHGVLDTYRVVLTRSPFWEPYSATNPRTQDFFTISSVGGTAPYESISGDVPGRVNTFAFASALSGPPSGPLYEIWAGFRSEQYGDSLHFLRNWDCGQPKLNTSGLLDNNTALFGGLDTTSYGAGYAIWTPGGGADNNMLARVTARLSELTPYPDEQNGEFIVLLRARVSSGGNRTFRVRLRSGYYDGDSDAKWRIGQRVAVPASGVSAGDWFYVPLGTVTIPPDMTRTSYSMTESFSLRIDAEVASGTTGNLEFDNLTLIPVAEGGLHLKSTYVTTTGGINFYCYVTTSPDERVLAYNRAGTGLTKFKSVQFDLYNWGVPTGEGRIVLAAQQEAASVLADNIQAGFDYYARWLTLRGSD